MTEGKGGASIGKTGRISVEASKNLNLGEAEASTEEVSLALG